MHYSPLKLAGENWMWKFGRGKAVAVLIAAAPRNISFNPVTAPLAPNFWTLVEPSGWKAWPHALDLAGTQKSPQAPSGVWGWQWAQEQAWLSNCCYSVTYLQ